MRRSCPNLLLARGKYWHEHVVSVTAVHDILHDVFIPLWEFNMASTDAFAILKPHNVNRRVMKDIVTSVSNTKCSCRIFPAPSRLSERDQPPATMPSDGRR